MEHYAGIDVSLEQSSVCVVDGSGKIVREAKVPSAPEALIRFLGQLGLPVTQIGLEAGPLSQWLHAGLAKAGLEVVLLETRQVKAALSAPRKGNSTPIGRFLLPLCAYLAIISWLSVWSRSCQRRQSGFS